MTGFKSIICVIFSILLPIPFITQAQSQIFFPLDNITYWSPGSLIQLPWTYNYTNSEITNVQWLFAKSGSTQRRVAIFFIEAGLPKPTIDDAMFSITGQATLEFRNVNLSYNGTYSFRVLLRNSKREDSEIDVIILEQPTAVIRCSPLIPIVKEGEDITCLCSATGGNPPATASWSKNRMMINGTGYLKKTLTLKNIGARDAGTYNCTVRSHNLTDTKFINITVKYKPRNISFSANEPNNVATSGYTVEITCKADAYPEAFYSISFNGSQLLTDAVNGVYNISSVNDSHAGNYTCVAKNIIGNVSAQFVLTVNVRPIPIPTSIMPSSVSMSTTPPDTQETSTSNGEDIAPIVGGAIGGVVLLIIFILLIWYFCCKRSATGSCKRSCKGKEDIVVNPSNPSYAAMGDSVDRGNPYESVDQAKIDQARAADEAGPSNESPPDAGNGLPPVYVVDKSKKTPKPPAEKQLDSLTYASLDPVRLQPDSSKMRGHIREDTNHASIDLEKLNKDQE